MNVSTIFTLLTKLPHQFRLAIVIQPITLRLQQRKALNPFKLIKGEIVARVHKINGLTNFLRQELITTDVKKISRVFHWGWFEFIKREDIHNSAVKPVLRRKKNGFVKWLV